MKLRFVPEDFHVIEQPVLRYGDEGGPYGVYLLTKRGWNTMDALARAARELGVPLGLFRYGGLKDRWAVTEQCVTFYGEKDCSGDWGGFSLRYLGRVAEPMAPSLIQSNSFQIIIRDLQPVEADAAARRAGTVRLYGFPNYFDDQRFGSMRDSGVFAGDLLVRRRWPQALEALVAMPGPDDPPAVKRHRGELARRWGDWTACLEAASGEVERRVFALLAEQPGAARAAVNLLPRETLGLHLAAWQSHVWNDLLRHAVRRNAGTASGAFDSHPGTEGPYLFPSSPEGLTGLAGLALPTMGRKIAWPDAGIEALCRELLGALGLRPENFVLRGLPKVQLYSTLRAAVVAPSDLTVIGPEVDESHPGRLKLKLGFSLPAGSFGTMLVKALSSRAL